MLTRYACLLAVSLAGASPFLLPSSVAARGEAGTQCPPISIEEALGIFTYTVRIERGSVSCRIARSVLHAAAEMPRAVPKGWRCVAGQDRDSWAISCVAGSATVRAYGPRLEPVTWGSAAASLRIPLLRPLSTLGLPLESIRVQHCGVSMKGLTADYGHPGGPTLTVAEGKPHTCGQLGSPVWLANWRIRGHRAALTEFCAPAGCARLSGEYALDWRERGVEITLMTHAIGQHELAVVARSMTAL